MCSAPKQGQTLPAGVDLEKETVITGRVVDGSGQSVGGAFVRLLDASDEFTAEVVASATGDFRFFAAVARGQRRRQRGAVGRGHPRGRRQGRIGGQRHPAATRLAAVVLFFEILLVATVVVITWFALYALYRLITDES
jgi:hypothetical protein